MDTLVGISGIVLFVAGIVCANAWKGKTEGTLSMAARIIISIGCVCVGILLMGWGWLVYMDAQDTTILGEVSPSEVTPGYATLLALLTTGALGIMWWVGFGLIPDFISRRGSNSRR